MSVLKEYIKRIIKENLNDEDFIVFWDWWMETYPKMGLSQIEKPYISDRGKNYTILYYKNKKFAPFVIDAEMVVWNYERNHPGPIIPRTFKIIYQAEPAPGWWRRPDFNYHQSDEGPVLDFNWILSLEEAINSVKQLITTTNEEAEKLKIHYDKEQAVYSNLTKIREFLFDFLEGKVDFIGKEETKERAGGYYYSHFISRFKYAWKKKLRGKRKLVINLEIDDRDFPTLFEALIFDKGVKRTLGKIEFNFQNPINFNETQKEIVKILSSAAIH